MLIERRIRDALSFLLEDWVGDGGGEDPAFWRHLGMIYSLLGHLEAALTALDSGERLEADSPEEAWERALARASVLRRLGRVAAAADLYDALLAQPAPRPRREAALLLNTASCFHQVGRAEEAWALLERSRSLRDATEDLYPEWQAPLEAWVLLALGRVEEAAAAAAEGRARPVTDVSAWASATRIAARVELQREPPRREAAQAFLEELVERSRRESWPAELADALEELAEVHAARGDHEASARSLREAFAVQRDALRSARDSLHLAEMARLRTERLASTAERLRERQAVLAEAAARLALQNEEKGRALRRLVHDLRNPLSVIVGCAEVLRRSPEVDRTVVDGVGESASRIAVLLDRALDGTEETPDLELERLDLGTLIRSLIRAYTPRAQAKGMTLDARIGALEPARTDGAVLGRIVDNLLVNAIKFGPAGQRIEVRLHQQGDRVVLEVADQGPGFAPDELERVFEEGFTGSASPTSGERSTGYGLAIVRSLARLLGGEATARNEGGAVVRVTFALGLDPPPRRFETATVGPG